MAEVSGYAFDMEADNFYLQSQKVWIIHFKSLDKQRELSLYPFRQGKEECKRLFMDWHNSFGDCPTVVSYNGIGYDHWMLWKHLDIAFHIGKGGNDWLDFKHKCKIVDLYVLSQFLSPDRPRHSLASWGEELHNSKIDFHDFSKYSEEMRIYCEQDVALTIDVYNHLRKVAGHMYGQMSKAGASFSSASKALHKDYYLYSAQAYTGILFDKLAAEKLIAEIDVEMDELEREVLPQLPPRKLKEGEKKLYTMPQKPYRKDGTLSAIMEKWIEKHEGVQKENGKWEFYGKEYDIIGGQLLDIQLPMEIKDGDDIKEWFMQRSWKPSMWNFKRDERGKPMRDAKGEVIITSPKIQEGGKICPNLLKLDGELPKRIVRFLSLRNRKSVVTGWLNNWRLEFDGRLSAEISGYTPTFRVKHSCITNLPKASPEVVKGYEMRSLFIVDKGMKYVSADAAALENRTVADYTFKHDNGKFADLVLNGDSHSYNATIFFPKETAMFDIKSPDFDKDDPKFKPWRNKAKTGAYSLAYGASVKKFTKSLDLTEQAGKVAYENYWNANEGLKKFKEEMEKQWEGVGQKKYIVGKDGRVLSVRSKHLLVNLCGQSLGATVITYALCFMDNKLGWLQIDEMGRPYYNYKGHVVKRLAAFHDQGDFEAEPEVAEEVGQLIVDYIKKAGEVLNMQVELDGEYKVGANAAEIH
jgi:hypothetical protein